MTTLFDRLSCRILLFVGGFGAWTAFFETTGWRFGPFWVWAFVLLFWMLAGRWARQAFPQEETVRAVPRMDQWLGLGVGLLFFVFAAYHMIFYAFEFKGNLVIRNPNLYGDWPFHLHQINYLTRLEQFWPENPIFALDHLRYAFGINWVTALFARGGIPIELFVLVSGVVALAVLIWQLHRWFGPLAIIAFFASGGGWAMSVADQARLWMPGPFAWKNLFLAVFVTQRGMWFALPAGVLMLRILMRHLELQGGVMRSQKRTVAFLWAVMPFFHLHTFFFMSLIIAGIVVFAKAPSIAFYFLRRLPVPLFFIFHSVGSDNLQRSVRLVSNWMSHQEPAWMSWFSNFGPWLLLPASVAVLSKRLFVSVPRLRVLFWIVLGAGVVFSHLMLAPWDWDQIKVLLWVYLLLSALCVRAYASAHIWLAAVFVLLHLPGLNQFSAGRPALLQNQVIWSLDEVVEVRSILEGVAVHERVLAAPLSNHPIFATGQALVSGYEGHLWSHGLRIEGLKEAMFDLVHGRPIQNPRWSGLRPRYLLWGPQERDWMKMDAPSPESGWILWRQVGNRKLYIRP